MAGEAAEFLLSLGDQVTPNAIRIAEGLDKLSSSQLKAAKQAVALDGAMARAAQAKAKAEQTASATAAAQAAARAAGEQKAALASQQAEAAAAKAKLDGMAAIGRMMNERMQAEAKAAATTAKAASSQKGSAATAAEAVTKVAESAEAAAPAASGAASAFDALTGALSNAGPEGKAAATALKIVAAAAVAAAAALLYMAQTAIQVVQERAGLLATFAAIAGGAGAGGKLLASVDALSTAIPGMRDKITEWSKSMALAGMSGKRLENAVKAIAAAQAVMGDSGAAAASGMIETLQRGGAEASSLLMKLKSGLPESASALAAMGLKVGDLAAALGMTEAQFKRSSISAAKMQEALEKALMKKGKGPLEEMALTWPSIMAKAREGVMSLFDKLGPAVKPFMKAIQSLFKEFSKGGATINLLKPIITSAFTTLFSWATKAVQAVTAVVKWIGSASKSGGGFFSAGNQIRGAWMLVSLALKMVWFALTPVIAGLKLVIGVALVLVSVWGAVTSVIMGFAGWVSEALSSLGATAQSAGGDFVAGLVGGISGGIGAVIGAVKGLAAGALGAFTGAFKINSPSRLMLEHGEDNIAGAAATGIDKGAAQVDDAMAKLGAGGPGAPKGGKGKSAGGPIFNNCTFFGTSEAQLRELWAKICEETASEAAGVTP